MNKTQKYLLFSLLGLVMILILFLQYNSISSTKYPSYASFYGMRQVENIENHGVPIIFDSYSYQGRININQVLFYYFISIFTLILPAILFFKYAGMLVWILIIFLMYVIANKLFANKIYVWLMTFFAILSPIIYTTNMNDFSSNAIFVLLFLVILNLFFNINKKNALIFILLILISTFISSLSLIFLLAFLIYLLLVKIASKKLSKAESEIMIFIGIFISWLHFILYRKLFLKEGINLFKASIPAELLLGSFSGLNIPMAISIAGLIPLVLGLYGVYHVLFMKSTKKQLLIVSFLISFIISLWVGLVPFNQAFLFITLLLILLSGISMREFNGYMNKTILQKLKPVFVLILLLLVVLNFLPVLNYDSVLQKQAPTDDEMLTMNYILEGTPKDATILSSVQEGHLIAMIAKRKNFFDTNFIFAPQSNKRYEDAKSMFLSKSQTIVLDQMEYYNIDYIYLSPQTKLSYNFRSTIFESSDCFNLVFKTNTTQLFEQKCNK